VKAKIITPLSRGIHAGSSGSEQSPPGTGPGPARRIVVFITKKSKVSPDFFIILRRFVTVTVDVTI
jgi:hypothetical protein